MNNDWLGKHYSFFQNVNCEYFPCHEAADKADFNCLFCYCPLYLAGKKCGGNFTYTKNGVKDCSSCLIPHRKENYGYIIDRFNTLSKEMNDGKNKD